MESIIIINNTPPPQKKNPWFLNRITWKMFLLFNVKHFNWKKYKKGKLTSIILEETKLDFLRNTYFWKQYEFLDEPLDVLSADQGKKGSAACIRLLTFNNKYLIGSHTYNLMNYCTCMMRHEILTPTFLLLHSKRKYLSFVFL